MEILNHDFISHDDTFIQKKKFFFNLTTAFYCNGSAQINIRLYDIDIPTQVNSLRLGNAKIPFQ